MKPSLLGRLARTLALIASIGGAGSALAMIYPEHRDITVLGVQTLDPERTELLNRLWRDARVGVEQRLCEQAADSAQGVAPACLDWAAFAAIGGDHS